MGVERPHVSVRSMREVLGYIHGMLLTLLPSRYRDREALRGHAMTCGLLQSFAALILLMFRLFDFVAKSSDAIGQRSEMVYDHIGGGAVYASGVLVIAEIGFHPLSIIGYYFFFEGVIRVMAALVSHQTIGTLALYPVGVVHDLWDKVKYSKYVGPLIEDEVVRGTTRSDYDLKIYSCRPKPDWNSYVTIEFEGQFYQLMRSEPGPEPLRFVYYLRKNPIGRLVVQIRRYRTDDVMSDQSVKTVSLRD
jgi:hypothetical protein